MNKHARRKASNKILATSGGIVRSPFSILQDDNSPSAPVQRQVNLTASYCGRGRGWNNKSLHFLYSHRLELWSPKPVEPGDILRMLIWDGLMPRSLSNLVPYLYSQLYHTITPFQCILSLFSMKILYSYIRVPDIPSKVDGLKMAYVFYWELNNSVCILPSFFSFCRLRSTYWGRTLGRRMWQWIWAGTSKLGTVLGVI